MKRYNNIVWFVLFACYAIPTLASGGASSGSGEQVIDLTTRMTTLVIQLGVILFAARLGNMLFERLKMPGVLGELCAGVLIGPSLLGGFALPIHGFENGLFYVAESIRIGGCPISPELYGICSVASIVLLFLVGIETDLKMFVRYSVAGSLVGVGGVVASFFVGDLMGVYLLPIVMPDSGASFTFVHPACVFLGVMSTATSVSITARILSEQKKMDSAEGVTTLAAAVIDDVLGIIVLAIGMSIAAVDSSGGGGKLRWESIAMIAVKSIGIWLGATVFGVIVSRKVSSGLKRLGSHTEVAILALAAALIIGGLFEEAHLAMIIGAYVLGLSLSRTDLSHMIREKLHGVYIFMVPVFFAVMGMMVNVKMMASKRVFLFGLVYTIGAILAKLIGCGLPALLCKFNLRGALRIGVGMVPRGEVALIVAGIGRASGLLSDEVFGVAVMMTLITTIAAPPMLVAVYKSVLSGLTKAGQARQKHGEAPPIIYTFPNEEIVAMLLEKLLSCLAREGFFTHTLNREEGLHQARKDDLIITVVTTPNMIKFDCPVDAVSVIRMLMIEVVAEYEQTVSELRKLLDDEKQLTISAEDLSHMRKHEAMTRYLSPKTMVPALKGRTKQAIVEELLDLLVQAGELADREEALAAVMKREEAMSTGLGHGLACPHARTDGVKQLVSAIGVVKEGIDYQSVDKQPVYVVLLTLSPVDSAGPYMAFQASALTALRREEVYPALLASKTPQEMHHIMCMRGAGK